jgi:predicted Zn-dependent protease with MMP-like domain
VVEISDDDFERMVAEVFDALPDDMVRGLENVAISFEDQPSGERPRLFGLYRGHPLTTRGVYGFGELPDRITLYKNNLEEHSADLDALRARVRIMADSAASTRHMAMLKSCRARVSSVNRTASAEPTRWIRYGK